MSWIRSGLAVSIVICGALAALPQTAHAEGTWRWPVKGPVALEYGARYTDGQDRSCSHGGIDIAASTGSAVVACAPGEVTFSGLVPAGQGNRTWAVTVLTGDGLRVTYLPLARASVGRGESLGIGEAIGELSGSGDASGAAPHLHLGVRRGERALDPLGFLEAVGSAAQPAPEPVPAHVPAPAKPPVSSPARPPVQAPAARPGSAAVSRTPVSVPSAPVVSPHSPLIAPTPSAAADAMPFARMPEVATLDRIAPVADPPRVRVAAVSADVGRLRGFLASALVPLALAGLAAACVWPVMREVLAARVGTVPEPVAVRHNGA